MQIRMVQNNQQPFNCYYCKEYAKQIDDYPVNDGIFGNEEDLTPRCELHWKYMCSFCEKETHFAAISWCDNCKVLTCINCGDYNIHSKRFFFYEYYYSIKCKKCTKDNPALDFAEFELIHPFQSGQIRPKTPISLWVPLEDYNKKKFDNKYGSGSSRFLKITENIHNLDSQYLQSFLNSNVTKLFDFDQINKSEINFLEIYGSYGTISNYIRSLDYNINFKSISEKNTNNKKINMRSDKTIIYYSITNLDFLKDKKVKFDIIYVNLILVDIKNLNQFLPQIYNILQKDGLLIISIAHPVYNQPNSILVKLPKDTARREDCVWILNNYNNGNGYSRKFSDYINNLMDNGFSVKQILEPEIDDLSTLSTNYENLEIPNIPIVIFLLKKI